MITRAVKVYVLMFTADKPKIAFYERRKDLIRAYNKQLKLGTNPTYLLKDNTEKSSKK